MTRFPLAPRLARVLRLALVLALTLPLAACDSNDDDAADDPGALSLGTVEMRIDGNAWTGSVGGAGIIADGSGAEGFGMAGSTDASGTDAVSISVFSDAPIATGTYDLGVVNGAGLVESLATYVNPGELCTSLNDEANRATGTLEITRLGGGQAQGRFSFDALCADSATGDTTERAFTEGRFNVPLGTGTP
jgi:hypothetical protein